MIKYLLVLFIVTTLVKAQSIQVFGLQCELVAVEITNCIYPIIKSTNLFDWEECGLLIPIPSQPRDAFVVYRVGADWNTNVSLWLQKTNFVWLYHTQYLSQIPVTIWQTGNVTKYVTNPVSKASAKSPKLVTTTSNFKNLPTVTPTR